VAKLQALGEGGDASALFVLGLLWEVFIGEESRLNNFLAVNLTAQMLCYYS
jgi:hypothetical protein